MIFVKQFRKIDVSSENNLQIEIRPFGLVSHLCRWEIGVALKQNLVVRQKEKFSEINTNHQVSLFVFSYQGSFLKVSRFID